MSDNEFPTRARAVVVGGGVIGCSTAYHLAKLGWEDVVLLPDAPGAWRVEARRGGGLAKGRVQLFPDGRVEARLTSPTRAFP